MFRCSCQFVYFLLIEFCWWSQYWQKIFYYRFMIFNGFRHFDMAGNPWLWVLGLTKTWCETVTILNSRWLKTAVLARYLLCLATMVFFELVEVLFRMSNKHNNLPFFGFNTVFNSHIRRKLTSICWYIFSFYVGQFDK
jgi:hypothetical protein